MPPFAFLIGLSFNITTFFGEMIHLPFWVAPDGRCKRSGGANAKPSTLEHSYVLFLFFN